MGLAVRAAGSGMKVVVVQFLKDGDSSELSILSSLPNVTVLSGKPVKGFSFSMTPEEKALVAKTHNGYLETAIALYQDCLLYTSARWSRRFYAPLWRRRMSSAATT